jgi:hypothetical protein
MKEEELVLSPAFTMVSRQAYSTLKIEAIYCSETSVDYTSHLSQNLLPMYPPATRVRRTSVKTLVHFKHQ